MPRDVAMVLVVLSTVYCSFALGNDDTYKEIAESGLREAREIISSELFGHYDVANLAVLGVEPLQSRAELQQDYGLARVTVAFSTKRNATRHPGLNPALFEPGSPMCKDWLYLHCGVPAGHVFDGKLQLLVAADRNGSWRVVSPHWRSRRQFPLHGYLLLEGREKEGYVVFPRRPER